MSDQQDRQGSGPAEVLVLSADVGAGHKQAAKAVVEAIQEARPATSVRVEDVMDHVPWLFRTYYHGGYILGMTRLPRLYGLGFIISNTQDSPRRAASERLRLASERYWLKGLGEKIVRWRPKVIVCTHFVAPPVIGQLIRSGELNAHVCVVVTDHFPHRWWYAEGMEQWFVPDEEGRERLIRWGLPAGTITLCDIPVRLKWEQAIDGGKVRSDWGLPAEGPIVLLSGGAEFTCGPVEAIAAGIMRACPAAQVVVLAGRNKELLARLSVLAGAGAAATANGSTGRARLTPVSFTDRAHELVGAASLMVTKPGGVTTAECCATGTPMVLLRPVPGQEGANADYLSAHGAAVVPGGPTKVVEAVRRLLEAPGELAAMSERAQSLHRPSARVIAKKVVDWLKNGEPKG